MSTQLGCYSDKSLGAFE